MLTLSGIFVTFSVTTLHVAVRPKNNLSVLSATKWTTEMIPLTSEGYPFPLHNCIVSRLVASGENPQVGGLICGGFMGSEKAMIHPAGYSYQFLVLLMSG